MRLANLPTYADQIKRPPLDASQPMMHGRALLRGRRIQGFSAGAAKGRQDAAECAWEPIELRPLLTVVSNQDGRHAKAVQ